MENKGIFFVIVFGWVCIGLILVLALAPDLKKVPDVAFPPIETTTTIIEITPTETAPIIETTTPIETTAPTEPIVTEPLETEPIITEPIDRFKEIWNESAIYIAKTVWGEARGCSTEEQIKVIWCILNRVDSPNFPNTIKEVVTSGAFHGYSKSFPCEEEFYNMALDIIFMWQQEKMGKVVDRTLESNMYYMSAKSDGSGHNFREKWN